MATAVQPVGSAAPGTPGTTLPPVRRRRRADLLLALSTPRLLRALLAACLTVSLAWGAVAAWSAQQRLSAANLVVASGGPLSYDAQQVYQSLSQADATEANAYLQSPVKPAAAIEAIHADVHAAEGYTQAIALAGADPATRADLTTLATGIPDYTSLVGLADVNNRFGELVGAAYVREASSFMRGTLLPAASDLSARENARLGGGYAQATGFPVAAVAIAALCAMVLGWAQWRLSVRTRRRLNLGLLAASLICLLSFGWLLGSYSAARSDLLAADGHGSVPAQALAAAEVTALRMHADESLTLISRDGETGASATELAALRPVLLAQLSAAATAGTGSPGARPAAQAVPDARAWLAAHAAVASADGNGQYNQAVTRATGASTAAFQRLEADLEAGISADHGASARSAASGDQALGGVTAELAAAALLMTAASAWGIARRLAEYR